MQEKTGGQVGRWSIHRWFFAVAAAAAVILGAQALLGTGLYAQKAQTDFKEKLRWASEDGDAAVACSADGKYVYVAGGEGVLVSDNFGKTGSWSLVLKGK
jgi:hypothetical protein